MDERQALASLRNALANLYSDEHSIRRIVFDAGLDDVYILFSSRSIDTWHTILLEARKHGKLEQICVIALSEYKGNKQIQEATAIYTEVTSAEKNSKTVSNVTVQEQLTSSDTISPCFCTNRRHFNFFVQTEPVLTRENKGKSAIAGNGEYDWKTSFDLAAQGDFP